MEMKRMTLRLSSLVMVGSTLFGAFACSAGGSAGSPPSRGGAGTVIGAGGAGIVVGSGGSGNSLVNGIDDQPGMVDPLDKRNLPVRKQVCDAAGNCSCLRLALLGTLDSKADETDTQPFVDWLNASSSGTATVTMISTKPVVDKTFLAQYDILLISNVNSWTFSPDEQAAVADWVKTTGGGIISLTGFTSEANEPAATSQLIKFAGISYGSTATATPPQAQDSPVYYKGGSQDLKNCFNWNPAPTANKAAITAPIHFTPQTDTLKKLTASVDYVGAFYGWNVVAPAGATVIGTDPVTKTPIAVAYEVMGAGRIFAWGDEWVIFKNQWVKSGMPGSMQADAGNKCWVPANGSTAEFFHSVESLYQTKQFWYDAINWVAPPNECNFIVDDPDVVVVK
jgi:hypothetical protein